MSGQEFRRYDPERDREAATRIWREVGWVDKERAEHVHEYIECGRALVADLKGEAECLVITAPGTCRYLKEELPFAGVTGVTTSRTARKQGFAGRLAARAIAEDAREGALVIGLGMFEQGFYNRLGFGTGGYEHWTRFDPATLTVDAATRAPRRMSPDEWPAAHAARLARHRIHGGVNLTPEAITKGDLQDPDGFGLAYDDGPGGTLSHYLWMSAKNVESGPYNVRWLCYRTYEELMELLGLLKSLADQVKSVEMAEPPGVQIQDLFGTPFRRMTLTQKSEFECGIHARAFWQARLCDVPGCLARTHLPGRELVFNLELTDPIEGFLPADSDWRGTSGSYVVSLGKDSWAEHGTSDALPTLRASTGAFTRLWLGCLSASSLAATDSLEGPPELLEALDWTLCLPAPKPGWDY